MINVLLIILFILACLNLGRWFDEFSAFLELEITELEFTILDIILLIISIVYALWFIVHFARSFII